MKATGLLVIALYAGTTVAAEPSAATQKEIQHLFSSLEGSACQFQRNGNWHTAQEASKHLRQKYQYLLGKGMISTTESFIEHGASASSVSRKPYQVRCGADVKADNSAVWFAAELARYRALAK